ncbi:MAG TPA: tRNA (adenosine(37)-N6)-dimethylallyltransferase MiaA, partial [bacterium]|nr:tRNA (adenosine(37)-N6)-dimethylallyltransferase MiaA [bacterium]
MDIGTAKPTPWERAQVPHHGLDLRDPDETFSAAEFVREARRTIDDITRRGRRVLLVGGTGMYVKALAEGWDFAGVGPDAESRVEHRAQLADEGLPSLVHDLLALDPAAAELVDLENPARVLRALEIVRSTGRPLAEVRSRAEVPFLIAGVVLTRPKVELDGRIGLRLNRMIHEGWLDEVRALQAAGPWPEGSPAMTGIGYEELARHLAGEYTLQYALERAAARTRQYAKRQLTWFRAQEYPFIEVEGDADRQGLAGRLAAEFLR